MTTRPADTEPFDPSGSDQAAPNPTRLPVEPEFGPQPPATEPEEPVSHHPKP